IVPAKTRLRSQNRLAILSKPFLRLRLSNCGSLSRFSSLVRDHYPVCLRERSKTKCRQNTELSSSTIKSRVHRCGHVPWQLFPLLRRDLSRELCEDVANPLRVINSRCSFARIVVCG